MKLEYIQTSCALCHDLTFLKIKAGKRLLLAKDCSGRRDVRDAINLKGLEVFSVNTLMV